MSVVMVTPNFHPYIGGAEKQALEVSKALARRGVEVDVLTRRVAGLDAEERVAGIPVHRVAAWGGGLLNALIFMISSLCYLVRRSPRVTHVHLAGSPALSACLAGRLTGAKVVVKIGGGRGIGEIAVSSRSWRGRLKLALLRFFSPQFVAVTQDLADEMREHGFTSDIRVIPNGVDVDVYKPGDSASLRAKFGWPAGRCFLYVGRLAPEKQLDRFLRAFAAAASPDAFCVFVGGGPEHKAIEAEIEKLKLGARARMLPSTEEIAEIYRAADIFILPSISEGLSNSLLEAMASGLATLGSRVGGTREVVVEGKHGLLFDPDDDEELRAKITTLCCDPDRVEAMGRAACELAGRRFSMHAIAERYLEVYGA